MENVNTDSKFIVKTALITFAKSLVLMVAVLFFVFSFCYVLFPKSIASVYEALGYNKGVVTAYERIYNKSKKNSDLYNLIQKSISANTYQVSSKYIEVLLQTEDYEDFVNKTNEALIKEADVKYIAYVGDLDGYLTSELVIAKYMQGDKEDAKKLAIDDLVNGNLPGGNIYSFALSAYLNCLINDSTISSSGLKSEVREILSTKVYDIKVEDLLEDRELVADYTKSSDLVDKILRVYTCLKIEKFKFQVYTILLDEELSSNAKEQVKVLQDAYDIMINA